MSEYLDTRGLVKRLDEIDTEIEEAQENNDKDWEDELDGERLEIEEIEGYCEDFRHGETMIPVDDFEDYARELANDIGAIDPNAGWPTGHIDWEKAARELAMDYTEVEYKGTSYYVR